MPKRSWIRISPGTIRFGLTLVGSSTIQYLAITTTRTVTTRKSWLFCTFKVLLCGSGDSVGLEGSHLLGDITAVHSSTVVLVR